MLEFSAIRMLLKRKTAGAGDLFKTMKLRDGGLAPASRVSEENIFNRTGQLVPEELKLYCTAAEFDWHRTWSAADCESDVGSPRTHLIKGRHYAHFPKPAPLGAGASEQISTVREAPAHSLRLFLISFSASSIVVFLLALFC